MRGIITAITLMNPASILEKRREEKVARGKIYHATFPKKKKGKKIKTSKPGVVLIFLHKKKEGEDCTSESTLYPCK